MSEQEDNFYRLIGMIQSEYPNIFALINQPGILEVALDIIQHEIDHTPYTGDQITAKLHATPFYQNTPEAGRNYVILKATDPASAEQLHTQRTQELMAWANTNGFGLTQDEAYFISGVSLDAGEAIEQTQRNTIQSRYTELLQSGQQGVSPVGDQMQAVAAQYGVPLSPLTLLDWQRQILSGDATPDTFEAYMREQAKSLYPSLGSFIDAGGTVRQYVDPYAQIASRELGINPNDFDLAESKWSAPIQQVDPKTGERTAMTLAQWQSTVRTDPTYGYDSTEGARDQASKFAASIAQQFGALG